MIPKFLKYEHGWAIEWIWLGRSLDYYKSSHFQYKGHPFCYTYPDPRDNRFSKDIWFGGHSKWGTKDL